MKSNQSISFLVNPFVRVAGWQALLIGLLFVVSTIVLGQIRGIAFDGVFDIHFSDPSVGKAFAVQGISLLVLVSVMYLLGIAFSKSSVRLIDVAGTITLSRAPFLLFAIVAFIPGLKDSIFDSLELFLSKPSHLWETSFILLVGALVGVLLLSVVVIFWFVALAYRAFSVSCNIKGVKNILIFTGGLVVSEMVSVAIILLLFPLTLSPTVAAIPVVSSDKQTYEIINKIALQSTAAIKKGDYEKVTALFDPTMKTAFPEAKLRETMNQLEVQFGKMGEISPNVLDEQKGEYRCVFVPIQFDKGKYNMQFTFNRADQICGFFIVP